MSAEPSNQRPPDDNQPAPASPPPQQEAGAGDVPVDISKLSPAEQMALYEKELKETDWGHQPC